MFRSKSIWGLLLVCTSVLAMAFIYGYHEKLNLSPQSVHHWRQSDCASITYNFYAQDLAVGESQIMGLVSDYGTSATNLTSELPFYYWGIGQMYKIFGPREWILRGINSLLFLSGIIAFIVSLWRWTGSFVWSFCAGALLFTSPVLVYYGNNFLSNAPSFGMALMSLAMLMEFSRSAQKKFWWLMVFFSLFAGSLKLPGLFLFFSVVGAGLLKPALFANLSRKELLISGLIVISPLISWILYARAVNQLNHTVYFSTTIFPLWELSLDEVRYILSEIKKLWLKDYGHWSLLAFFLLLLLSVLFNKNGRNRAWFSVLLLLITGVMLYSLLQFYTFMQHDYYVINMFMLPALLIVVFSADEGAKKILRLPVLLVPLILLLAYNTYYASQRHEFRYEGFHNVFARENPALYGDFSSWLAKHGVDEKDTVIIVADDSHTSLYLSRRYGWTTHKMAFKDSTQTMFFNRDSVGIARSINNGASHLILLNWTDLYDIHSYLSPFTKNLLAQNEKLMVFDLKDSSTNFHLPERKLYKEIVLLPDTSKYGDQESFRIKSSDTYSLSRDIRDLSEGMLVEVECWVKADPEKKLVPVISSVEAGLAFIEFPDHIESKGSWRCLKTEYEVSSETANQGIKCFMWNPEGIEALLDTLTIRVYQPIAYP